MRTIRTGFGILVKNRVVRNASWIIICRIIQAVIAVIISMLTARYLGPSNFGLMNYASSLVAFMAPIMYLGFNSVIVQDLVESPEKEGEILGTAITLSSCSAVMCMGGIFAFVNIVNAGERDTIIVCTLYSTLLVFQAVDLIQYWFQAKLKSKYTSVTILIAYTIVAIYKIYLLATGKNIYWFAVSQSLDYLIIAVTLNIIYRKSGGAKLTFNYDIARDLFSKSKYYIISSMMVTVFAHTDRIMLKLMIDDAAAGYYSAAVSCAGMSSFVFSAIIDSARPIIIKNHSNNRAEFEKNMILLYRVVIILAFMQSVIMTLFAEIFISILYGESYCSTTDILRICVWYNTFSYMGAIRNIWILIEKKQKYLGVINISGASVNVLLNVLLIPIWGANGAALASLITQFFTNFILGFILQPIRANNKFICDALRFK